MEETGRRDRCWAVIDLDIVAQNARAIKRRIPDTCAVMAVVKGDGYGHGIVPMARACANAGVEWLGTATLEEAVCLRENGITLPILILGVTPPERGPDLLHFGLTPVVPSLEYAKALAGTLRDANGQLSVHIAVDTGMGRLGWWVQRESIPEICNDIVRIGQERTLKIQGIMTHLSSARGSDAAAVAYTRRQLERFQQLCEALKTRGIAPRYRHVLNSGGLIHHSDFAMEMVRIGHLLCEPLTGAEDFGLRPAMEIKTTIAYIKELPAGACVGYGRSCRLARPARIAVLNIGYCDGYPGCLSNKGVLLVRGIRVPVVGSVCMDQMMIDISQVPEAAVGDTVTIVGRDGDDAITMEEVSRQAEGMMDGPLSIQLTNRMPRYYKRQSRLAGYRQIQEKLVPLNNGFTR